MQESLLLKTMFEEERWQELIKKCEEKFLSKKMIQEFCKPEKRSELYYLIATDRYTIFPPHIALIPKGETEIVNGEVRQKYRTVYINEDRDRMVLTLINDCLCELFKEIIHPNCKSYQKGMGTQQVVKEISLKIPKIQNFKIGYKSDFSKYFDSVKIEAIDDVFDELELRLGFEKGTEPVINLLRRYYHQDLYFDQDGNLKSKFQSLKQGCAVASFLANVILYELDEFMSNKYQIYYRYSDDTIVLDENTENAIEDMNSIIAKYGITLNPKKVEVLYQTEWFKFLGFSIKGNKISLSKNRIKNFQKEVEKRTIKSSNSYKKARAKLKKYLFEGDYCWANSCLGIINSDEDLRAMSYFIFDCLRLCKIRKGKHKMKSCDVGGLGYEPHNNGVVSRGKGKRVRTARDKTEKEFEDWISIKCLSDDMKIHKKVFEAVINNL